MICPVCLASVATHDGGVTARHHLSTGALCPMSGQEALTWDEGSTRQAVTGRSCGICEFCGHAVATDMHHRKGRGVGGLWSPANILHLCRSDHSYFTDHPTDGYQLGVLVRGTDDPQAIPVTTRDGQRLWLTDDVCPPLPKGLKRAGH